MLPQTSSYDSAPLALAASAGATAGVLAHLLLQAGLGAPVAVSTGLVRTILIGFAFATWQLHRRRDPEAPRPRWVVRAGGSLAGFAATFGALMLLAPPLALSSLERRALPGFALALPAGTTSTGTYAQGSAEVELGREAAVLVSWQTGALPSRDDVPLLGQAMSSMMPGRSAIALIAVTDRSIAGQPGLTATVTGAMRGSVSWFACDGRWVMVLTVASRSGAADLHDRVLAGARCTPEPHAAEIADLTADRRSGWYAAPTAEPGALAALRDDGTMLFAQSRPVEVRADRPVPGALLETTLAAAGLTVTLGAGEADVGPDGPRTIWTARTGDFDVVAMGWYCEAPRRIVLAFGLAPHREPLPSSRDELRAQLRTVRCLAPDEAPLALPALPAE